MLFMFRRGLLYFKEHHCPQYLSFSNFEQFIKTNVQKYNNEKNLKMLDIYFAVDVSVSAAICLLKEAVYDESNELITDYFMPTQFA